MTNVAEDYIFKYVGLTILQCYTPKIALVLSQPTQFLTHNYTIKDCVTTNIDIAAQTEVFEAMRSTFQCLERLLNRLELILKVPSACLL